MVSGDEYTVHVAIHHLEADAMEKLLRRQPADLFVLDYEKYKTRSTTSILINNMSGRLRYEIP
jgi:hypothetical protein